LYNASWLNNTSTFPPSSLAVLKVSPKDKYGNIIKNLTSKPYPFVTLHLRTVNKDNVSTSVLFGVNSSQKRITFTVPIMAGNSLLHVGDEVGTEIQGSPFLYTVLPG
jgi:hypothetical protein